MEEETYNLLGWMRFVDGDGWGIPVFCDGSNKLFLPETDEALRLTRFHEFYNEEGYRIDYTIPSEARLRTFRLGDGVPIPFSKAGMTLVVDSGSGLEVFQRDFAFLSESTVYSYVFGVLEQAKNQSYERQALARIVERFEEPFGDVFTEPPVHSRYWLDRLEAVSRARLTLHADTRDRIADKLRGIYYDWVNRFAMSGETSYLDRICDIALQTELLTPDAIKTLYFHLVSRALDRRDYRKLRDRNLISSVLNRVPEGIYHFEVFSTQESVIKFAFRTKTDVLEDFADVLYNDLQIPNFRNTLCISILLFGNRPLPPDNYVDISETIRVLVDRLNQFWRENWLMRSPPASQDFPPPTEVADNYRALNTLRRVADWQHRAAAGPLPTGLGGDFDLYLARTIGSPMYDWRTATND